MRLDYVVGREAARRRKTRQAGDYLLVPFSSAVDEMTNRASERASERADARSELVAGN